MTRQRMLRRPTPMARPRGSTLHWVRTPLMRAHLLFLLAATTYVLFQHPQAVGPVLLIACTAVIAELAPSSMRRFFLGEALLLISGVVSFMWAWDVDTLPLDHHAPIHAITLESFQGWIRMVFVAWLLVPSRPGYLRWFAGLCGVELALRSRDVADGTGLLLLLVPTAVIALAWDAHLRVATLRPDDVQVGRSIRATMLRWNGALIAIICVAALAFGIYTSEHHGGGTGANLPTISLPQTKENFAGLNQSMHLGDNNFTDQNPIITAKLTTEQNLPEATYYLRALTLPNLDIEGAAISWKAEQDAPLEFPPRPILHSAHDTRMATLYRRADNQPVVLMPDGSSRVGLEDMRGDVDGNLYRPGLGEITTRYQVDMGAEIHPLPQSQQALDVRYLRIDNQLARRLERELQAIGLWRQLEPQHAANAITSFLRSRCSYHLGDLPDPEPARGGQILTFLFDSKATNRIGHCQFFATAAVLLMRTAGHPARCVVGYASNEVDGNEVLFRGANAHAWAEYQVTVGDATYWRRFDPTPPSHLALRAPSGEGIDAENPFGDEDVPDANEVEAEFKGWRQIFYWTAGIALLVLFSWLVWRLNRGQIKSPRERQLNKSTEQLVSCALQLGISVNPHTSLSTLAEAIQEHTGVDLQECLRAHLAARFAKGPMPPPWPIAQLKEAIKAKRLAGKNSPRELAPLA